MTDFRQRVKELGDQGMLRSFTPLTNRQAGYVCRDGRTLVNLSSNDYLGLAGDEALLERFYRTIPEHNRGESYALGVASSRLLTGDNPLSHQLESLITELYGSQACLLFNSGYHANIGIISALFGKRDLVLSDKLNHASIHDGLRICRAAHKRYRHCDYRHLRSLLEKYRSRYDKVVIVSESVFSMDGDCADLSSLVALKEEYDCLLYVDEAHGIGLYGTKGLGLVEQNELLARVDLLVGTFGKACGSIGAFLVCSSDIYDFLVNFSRSLIFTTALPPVVLSWIYFVMQQIPEMSRQRKNLEMLSGRMRSELRARGLKTRGETNIVPVIIGDAERTVVGAQHLQEHGYLVMPVRPPTVPAGTSRFRLSLTADLSWDQVQPVPELIKSWLCSIEAA